MNPNFSDALKNRGGAWFYKKSYAAAIADYTLSLAVNPHDPETYFHRAVALSSHGEYRRAVADYLQAIEQKPDFAAAYNQVAWILATSPDPEIRNGPQALEMIQKALNLQPDPEFYDTLSAVYAELRRFKEAAATQQKVVGLMEKEKDHRELAVSRQRLKAYQAKRPWRESEGEEASIQSVNAFLSDWREAWEGADLEAYLAFYHPNAVQGTRKGRDRIAKHKQTLWQRKKPCSIFLGQPSVSRKSNVLMISFRQEYTNDQGDSDTGAKTLTLTPYGDRWLIVRERWRPD